MKTVEISDELYENLKAFVVDPFDDTAEVVIGRLIIIANKAKQRWSALGSEAAQQSESLAARTRLSNQEPQDAAEVPVVL